MKRRSSAARAKSDAAPVPVREARPEPEPSGIDGYRVIRTIGIGSRAQVLLAHADEAQTSVAIKAFEPHVSDVSVATEVAACEAAQSLHVVKLLDASFGVDQPRCIVLERLDGGTLVALLRARERIRAGEAVTILVSVLRGIRALHDAGFAHGAVSLSTILFDRAGRPVLIGLGHAVELEGPGECRAEVGADWDRYRTVTKAVLERVETEGRTDELAHIDRVLDQLASAGSTEAVDRAESALFALDQPAPVRLDRGGNALAGARQVGLRSQSLRQHSAAAQPESAGSPQLAEEKHARRRRAPSRGVTAEGFAAWAEAVWDAGPLRTAIRRLSPFLRARKKQLIVAGTVAGVVAIAGLAAVPSGAVPSGAVPSGAVPPGASAATTSSTGTSSPATSSTQRVEYPAEETQAPPHAGDPVAATTVLLVERARCLAIASVPCLNTVDQADSAQLAADRALLQQVAGAKAEPTVGYDRFTVSLIQRTGDSALVELTPPRPQSSTAPAGDTKAGGTKTDDDAGSAAGGKPASALVIKGEAGWRLRQIFEN
ncbi:protein kinase domain-containing protein [Rathayibacter soli]|uniref:protein kinase domain-containing protein n=1 Tax=Rathayibacter soli TaxID=3144168 RepID=UPI0027E454C3|nr:protein kinase [Glaciibacter superstes]